MCIVIQKVRCQLNAKGANTVRSLGRVFNTTTNDEGTRMVAAQEFFVGINESGVTLTKDETNALLAQFDTCADGTVNYDAFLSAVRGSLNCPRAAAVVAAFSKFDISGSGSITASDLKAVYNVSSHPRVISGDMTEDEAFLEFLSNFADRNNDGRISQTEWNDFYSAVSASVDNDEHFVALVNRAWAI